MTYQHLVYAVWTAYCVKVRINTPTYQNVILVCPGKTQLYFVYNQLRVSGNDGSHYQADNENVKRKILQLHQW